MNVREEIEGLVAFEGRGPGTDAERRTAGQLAERLQELGREAELESIDVWPNWPMTYAIHVAMAIVGSVVSVTVPLVGALLVLIAVVLTFLDAIGIAYTTRRLLGRRASQNVISRESDEDKGGDLYLVAHYDAGRGGLAFHPKLQERRAAIGNLLKRNIGPLQPLFWAMVLLLICVLIRLPGIDSQILTVVQFIPTVLLILALPFLLDTALASVVPGANDNASGVATVLRLTETYGGRLEHFNLNLLLTGSQEAMSLGMRGYLKKRKGKLDPARSVFVNVDEVGRGTVRFTSREGPLLAVGSHEQLLELCEEIAEDQQDGDGGDHDDEDDDGDDGGGRPALRSMEWRTSTDGYAARSAGFPAITITCKGRLDYTPGHHQRSDTPDRLDDEAMERAYAFTAELIERLDQTVGPDLSKSEDETVLTEES
jgi:Peptidase family M28